MVLVHFSPFIRRSHPTTSLFLPYVPVVQCHPLSQVECPTHPESRYLLRGSPSSHLSYPPVETSLELLTSGSPFTPQHDRPSPLLHKDRPTVIKQILCFVAGSHLRLDFSLLFYLSREDSPFLDWRVPVPHPSTSVRLPDEIQTPVLHVKYFPVSRGNT